MKVLCKCLPSSVSGLVRIFPLPSFPVLALGAAASPPPAAPHSIFLASVKPPSLVDNSRLSQSLHHHHNHNPHNHPYLPLSASRGKESLRLPRVDLRTLTVHDLLSFSGSSCSPNDPPRLTFSSRVQVWAISSQHHVNAHSSSSSFHCSPTVAENLSHSQSRFLRAGRIGRTQFLLESIHFIASCLPPAPCTASLIDLNNSFCVANQTHHFPYSRILVQHNLWLMWM